MKAKRKQPKTSPTRNLPPAQTEADQRFESVIETHLKDKGVTQTRMFGSTGLKINGKVFAVLYKDHLVLKLPKERVETLVESGQGDYFDPGHGRVSKGWVSVRPDSKSDWLGLAKEAKDFVASGL